MRGVPRSTACQAGRGATLERLLQLLAASLAAARRALLARAADGAAGYPLAEHVRAEGPDLRHGGVAEVRQAEDVLDGAQQGVVVVGDGADRARLDQRGQQDRADAAAAASAADRSVP